MGRKESNQTKQNKTTSTYKQITADATLPDLYTDSVASPVICEAVGSLKLQGEEFRAIKLDEEKEL